MKTTVEQYIAQDYLTGHQLEPLSFAIWSTVHSMCSLYIRERIKAANLGDPQLLLVAGITQNSSNYSIKNNFFRPLDEHRSIYKRN